MNAKKCKTLRRAVRRLEAQGVVDTDSVYEVAKSGTKKHEGLEGSFAFRTWHTIKLADCARARYRAAKEEWKALS